VFHHNVLAGGLSGRQGLANWRSAHRRLLATGADVILCGHDHQEGAGQIQGALAVSTSGTHSLRVRGGRPSVFNLVRIDAQAVHIQHFRWESSDRRFLPSDTYSFARKGPPKVAVSVAGGDQGL
jgi:3',5'-cyclic AMP phosphodiesterase CpdA